MGQQRSSYSFLTKSAKLKRFRVPEDSMGGYSFLTKSAKLKRQVNDYHNEPGYSFLTKSAKLKLPPFAPWFS